MNSNVEVINPNLMGVRFSWVEAGFISDFTLQYGKLTNQHATLTADGIIILNRDDEELYNAFKKMLDVRVMKYTDEQIQSVIQGMESKRGTAEWDKYAESLLFLFRLEQTRRTIKPPNKPRSWLKKLLGRGAQ